MPLPEAKVKFAHSNLALLPHFDHRCTVAERDIITSMYDVLTSIDIVDKLKEMIPIINRFVAGEIVIRDRCDTKTEWNRCIGAQFQGCSSVCSLSMDRLEINQRIIYHHGDRSHDTQERTRRGESMKFHPNFSDFSGHFLSPEILGRQHVQRFLHPPPRSLPIRRHTLQQRSH